MVFVARPLKSLEKKRVDVIDNVSIDDLHFVEAVAEIEFRVKLLSHRIVAGELQEQT